MKAKEGERTQGPLPPEQQHLGICSQVIDFGTQMESYQGAPPKPVRKVFVQWDLPKARAVFNAEKGEQCFTVKQKYTFSLDPKANFRKMLDSWMGAPITELDSAKIMKLLNRPCMIQVKNELSKKDGLIRPKIANSGIAVYKKPADVAAPKTAENPAIFFDLENFDQALFATLPEWMQKEIRNSKEFKELAGGSTSAAITNNEEFEDDPF